MGFRTSVVRNLVFFIAVAGFIVNDAWAQNRGSSRYIPTDGDNREVSEVPRRTLSREPNYPRRQRLPNTQDAHKFDEEVYQPPDISTSYGTTGRRVPSRSNPQDIHPHLAAEGPIEYVATTTEAEEIQSPSTVAPPGRQLGRRRRPKKKRRPQTTTTEATIDQTQRIPETDITSIRDLLNHDEKRPAETYGTFHQGDTYPVYDPHISLQPDEELIDKHQGHLPPNEPASPYFEPQSPTNRLPAKDSSQPEEIRRGYPGSDSPDRGVRYGPAKQDNVRSNREYVPVLTPIRAPTVGTSRLPIEDSGNKEITRDASLIGRNHRSRSHGRKPASQASDVDHKKGLSPKPSLNIIPEVDEHIHPGRTDSEVRLPINESPRNFEYVPEDYESNQGDSEHLRHEGGPEEDNYEPPKTTNRLPTSSELHYESVYPSHLDGDLSNVQRISRDHTAPVDQRRNPSPSLSSQRNVVPSYTHAGQVESTNPQEYDNHAQPITRQPSRYQPPLQRGRSRYNPEDSVSSSRSRYNPKDSVSSSGSRYNPEDSVSSSGSGYNPEDSVTSSRSRYNPSDSISSSRSRTTTQSEDLVTSPRSRATTHREEFPTEVPRRGRNPSRNPPLVETSQRNRGQSRYQTDSPTRARSTSAPRSEPTRGRSRNTNRYQSDSDESGSRLSSRRPTVNPDNDTGSNYQYSPQMQSGSKPSRRAPSRPHSTPEDDSEESLPYNTLRSGPQHVAKDVDEGYSDPEYSPNSSSGHRHPSYVPEYEAPRRPVRVTDDSRLQPETQPPSNQNEYPQYREPQHPRSHPREPTTKVLPEYQEPQNPRPHTREPDTRELPQYQPPQNRWSQSRPQNSRSSSRTGQEEAPPPPTTTRGRASGGSGYRCPDAFGFFADPVQCDKYYECRNGTAEVHLCSDGLAFNEVSAPKYLRCDSLRDVDCSSRPELQEPKSSPNCPRKFGLFPHEEDCTKFFNCVDGTSTEVQCPPGLTYNDERATCDWADLVKTSCKTEDLLGFTCPEPTDYDLQDGVYTRYPHPSNCQLHFTCIKGADGQRRPRMLSCNDGLVFNPETGSCARPEEVRGCEEFYGPRKPAPKRKPAPREPAPREPAPREPTPREPEEEEYEEPTPRPRRRNQYRRTRN